MCSLECLPEELQGAVVDLCFPHERAALAGAGLAQVVPDARRESDRIRRAALFENATEPVEGDATA